MTGTGAVMLADAMGASVGMNGDAPNASIGRPLRGMSFPRRRESSIATLARCLIVSAWLAAFSFFLPACSNNTPTVVIYTAHDEYYSRPILDTFEEQTGIRVLAVYDTEAAKTTGLVNRLIAEKARPRADVFWNNEVIQTIRLQNEGLLEAYDAPNAAAIPNAFKDPEHHWTGFAARARVIIYNTNLVTERPHSIRDLLDPKWKDQTAVAIPLFGTTATHAAALFAEWGDDEAREFFVGLKENGVAFLPGNGPVRDRVGAGDFAWGLTDTDDANGGVEDGLPVQWLLPDQDDFGTLLIPNTVALIQGGPNTAAGKQLIDYLLSPEVEARLAGLRSIQIPLNPAVKVEDHPLPIEEIVAMPLDFNAAAKKLDTVADFWRTNFE